MPVLCDALRWLPVTAQIQFQLAALTIDCVRGTGAVYLKQVNRSVSNLSRRSLRSAGCGDLFVEYLGEIEAWFQRTTNRKWHMGYQMVT